jgi:hypothetical protein
MSVALATVAMRSGVTRMSMAFPATRRRGALHMTVGDLSVRVDANRPRAVGCGSPEFVRPTVCADEGAPRSRGERIGVQVAGHVTNLVWASGSDSDDDSPEYLVAQRNPLPLATHTVRR